MRQLKLDHFFIFGFIASAFNAKSMDRLIENYETNRWKLAKGIGYIEKLTLIQKILNED